MDNPAIKNGLFLGFGIILLYLVLYFISPDALINFSSWAAFILYIYFMYRSAVEERALNGNVLSFGDALKASFLTYVIGALIAVLFSYVLYNFIDPGLVDIAQEKVAEAMEKMSGLLGEEAQEEMEAALEESMDKMNYSLPTLLQGYVFSLIFGFIIALIIAAITKRNDNPQYA